MFSKKKPEGTEDQAYELMNLGGFGGLQRKSSPDTNETKPHQDDLSNTKQGLEALIDWSKEHVQNNPNKDKILGIIGHVERNKNSKEVLFIADIIVEAFKRFIHEQDFTEIDFIQEREKAKVFISLEQSEKRRDELATTTTFIANLVAVATITMICTDNDEVNPEQAKQLMMRLASYFDHSELI